MPDRETYLINLSDVLVPLIWSEHSEEITQAEMVFIAIWQLEAEINNGGFSQYFFNSAGDLASETPDALRAIGANHTATIVSAANALFPGGPPANRESRQDALDSVNEEMFEEWDSAFLAYHDDLSTLLYEYVQANRPQIRGS